MNPILEQGFCREILAKLATQLEGMSYDDLKDYVRGRQRSRRHFEATFNKSLLDVLIHAPFDLRTIGGVNRIVRSESAPAPDVAAVDRPSRPGIEAGSATRAPTRALLGAGDGGAATDEAVIRAAMLAELPPGSSRRKSQWKEDTKHRPDVTSMELDDPDFDLGFEDLLSSLMIHHEVHVDPAKPKGPDPWFQRSGS